jgi:hypothetical protein
MHPQSNPNKFPLNAKMNTGFVSILHPCLHAVLRQDEDLLKDMGAGAC